MLNSRRVSVIALGICSLRVKGDLLSVILDMVTREEEGLELKTGQNDWRFLLVGDEVLVLFETKKQCQINYTLKCHLSI
jgi:hypothetical protein